MRKWMNNIRIYFRDLKFRSKINLVLMLSGIAPLVIVGIFTIYSFHNMLADREYESLEVSLNQTCDTIDKQVEIYANLLNYFVFDQDLQKVLENEQTQSYQAYHEYVNVVDPILNTPQFYHDGIKQLTIYAENILIPHDVTLAPLETLSSEPWFKDMQNSDSEMLVYPNEDYSEILFMRKFPGYSDTTAYLGMYCDMHSFTEPLNYFKKEGTVILLTNEHDKILFSLNGLSDTLKFTDNDIYIKKKIENLPLYAYIYIEKDMNISGFHAILSKSTIVVTICMLIIFVISRYMSYIMVKRLEALTTCIKEVDYENMEINIYDDSQDEVGVLIRSSHTMLQDVKRLISEVYQSKIIQQELEMIALQAQINPHFLYNTLSLINWKALSAGEDDISKVTLALSDYYRTTLNKGKNLITVGGEITNIKSYLEIQLMMHDYDFEVEYQIDPELSSYWMPKLTLQPLIENCLEHGLDIKETGEKRIIISCIQDQNDIIWTVEDTGVGMDQETVANMTTFNATGYGVKNVNDRLALLCGENYALHIESTINVGTKIEIHIPKKISEEMNTEAKHETQ